MPSPVSRLLDQSDMALVRSRLFLTLTVAVLLTSISGCFVMRPSHGGGQTTFGPPRKGEENAQ